MPVNFKAIGKRLKEIRKREGLSQASLAEKADLSAQYVSQIETAKKRASLESLVKMANAMHVSVDDLLYGNMPENPKEYQTDISDLMNDCSCFEKRILFELLCAAKEIIRENIVEHAIL